MPATIRDIKAQTGLSLATISKYINGGNVLPENKKKIEAAIKDLHYEVNEIARGLVTNRTRTVGIMVYSIESLFNGTILRYIGDRLRQNGYGMLICDSCNDKKIEAENVRFLLGKKIDGIIVLPVSTDPGFLRPAVEAEVPVVLVDRTFRDAEFDCVKIDNRRAAARAVNELIKNNHRDIAVISGAEYTGAERLKGYMDAMEQAGLKVPDSYVKVGTHCIEYGAECMHEFLSMPKRPTAVFLTNYELTLGAVMTVNESKYKCPDNISIIGFDDLILCHVVKPKMCLVVQPMKEMGEKAVDILLRKIESSEQEMPLEVTLGTRIEKGNSIRKL